MSRPKKQIPLTINQDKPTTAVESRFLAFYENLDSKMGSMRELLFAGFILREIGAAQIIVDLERNGLLPDSPEKKREKIIQVICGGGVSFSSNTKNEEPEQKKEPVAVSDKWSRL